MKLYVWTKAGARRDQIKKSDENHWEIWTTRLPIKNNANKTITDMVAKELGVAKSRVEIISGNKSRLKVIGII